MPWERRRYRTNKVWIRVDEAGELALDDRGLAALRYKVDDERTYTVRPAEIEALEADSRPVSDRPASEGDAIHIYTDGAAAGNPGRAGAGAVLLWRGHRREISRFLGEATNDAAELAAVEQALEVVSRPDLPVRLHVDSTYVEGALSGQHAVRANVERVRRIQVRMKDFADLRIQKVQAHAENERADQLARLAIRTGRSVEQRDDG